MEETTIHAKVVEEIIGSPKEHVSETLTKVITKIKEDFKILKETTYEPEEIQGLWSTFAYLEIEFKNPRDLIGFCFDFMPGSIEIIKPLQFKVEGKDVEDMMNDLLAKLHRYDMVYKNLTAENKLLKEKLG